MFPFGGSELTPEAKKILKVITENFKDNENKIAIEGHTDAPSYSSNWFTNWELSTERASIGLWTTEDRRTGKNPVGSLPGCVMSLFILDRDFNNLL